MNLLALLCYFLAMFGTTWMLCMRSSDWNTERWSEKTRWMKLVFGALAWILVFIWLGQQLYPGDAKQSEPMSYAFVTGMPSAIAIYALVAWLSPGTAGALRMAPSKPPVIPEGGPKSKREWLLFDLRAIPELLRRRKNKKK
jgi:hypothetical protein